MTLGDIIRGGLVGISILATVASAGLVGYMIRDCEGRFERTELNLCRRGIKMDSTKGESYSPTIQNVIDEYSK